VSVEPIVEFSFGIAAQGYERSAVDARIEELALEHENVLRRAEDLQREIAETTRAASASGEQELFAFVLGRLQSTLGAAHVASTGLQRAGETRAREERAAAHEMIRRQLMQLEDESQRAVAAAEAAARRLIEEAGRAAAELRSEAAEAAARITAGAQDVMEVARTKTEQRTKEIVGELTAWQQAHESAQAATQAAADGRLEQAGRAATAYGEQARSTLDCAAQTASRMTGEARLEADRLLAESQRGADHLRQESERAAAEVAVNLRSIGRFVDGLPLPAGLTDLASEDGRPTADSGRGSISEISALWPRRRTRSASGQEPGRSERIR
jgi:cell division septum initiation protein DivIVA